MAASVFESGLLSKLFDPGAFGRLFSDSAEVRAMMLVEGALAKAQGAAGIIPELSAAAIHRASLELQIDPAGLGAATARNGVCVPALVTAFRDLMQAPEHAQYLHWGATSQDIIDTALMLRLKPALEMFDAELRLLLRGLAALADRHSALPVAARTYGQDATPTSFGAQCAGWGWPLLAAHRDLQGLRAHGLWVSLSGAAGTASALGPDPAGLRADLAKALGLHDPGHSWHTDRTPILALAGWVGQVLAALGKLGQDLTLATQSGNGELQLAQSGASSTMPQKQNPVGPAVLSAIAMQGTGLLSVVHAAASPVQARDGAAWFAEWLVLPQLFLGGAAALSRAVALVDGLTPNGAAMQAHLAAGRGLPLAEALSFALTDRMSRPNAQAAVKSLCREILEDGGDLVATARARWPDLPDGLFDAKAQLGTAPQEARAFVAAVRELG